ncbi:hypothetical protein ambt_16190 [Alteromonas naphthalenivorans]|uniref:Uncharacterized protein n=1 Tax=Alteromonas naphthalenivorans TaxID=715451 RepID=F5Z599_ALTNA|nr:hypothetical protein ambt_16190 [Alteromonas naphthalenivorans]
MQVVTFTHDAEEKPGLFKMGRWQVQPSRAYSGKVTSSKQTY